VLKLFIDIFVKKFFEVVNDKDLLQNYLQII